MLLQFAVAAFKRQVLQIKRKIKAVQISGEKEKGGAKRWRTKGDVNTRGFEQKRVCSEKLLKAPRLQLFLLVVRRCGGAVMQWCSASDLVAVA